MPLFVEVARQKSFAAAADKLDMYGSTLSRRIAALEKEIGVMLFMRNTRRVELTTAGSMLHERCEFILKETDSAWNAVRGNMTSLAGPVRVSMYDYTYHHVLQGVLSKFIETWPDIQLSVNFNDRVIDLMTEPYDVDIRAGPLPDSDCKARKLLTVEPGLYASPRLFESCAAPRRPEDLTTIPCIFMTRMGNEWPLYRSTERKDIRLRPAFIFGSASLCHEFALAGHGVTMIRQQSAEPYVKMGKLIRVLPEWTGPCYELFMVSAPGQSPKRVQVFVDYMANHFKLLPEREPEL